MDWAGGKNCLYEARSQQLEHERLIKYWLTSNNPLQTIKYLVKSKILLKEGVLCMVAFSNTHWHPPGPLIWGSVGTVEKFFHSHIGIWDRFGQFAIICVLYIRICDFKILQTEILVSFVQVFHQITD